MRDYDGWSFRGRAFLSAVALSVLWHLFWFFSITVTVNPNRKLAGKPKPKIVSLGPVLDDTIFRALIENKPQLSETFYRRLSDYENPVDLEVTTMARRSTGEVVSLPFGKRVWSSMRELLSGERPVADDELSTPLSQSLMEEERRRREEELRRLGLMPAESEDDVQG